MTDYDLFYSLFRSCVCVCMCLRSLWLLFTIEVSSKTQLVRRLFDLAGIVVVGRFSTACRIYEFVGIFLCVYVDFVSNSDATESEVRIEIEN